MKKMYFFSKWIKGILSLTLCSTVFFLTLLQGYSLETDSATLKSDNGFNPVVGFFVALMTLFFGYVFEYFSKNTSGSNEFKTKNIKFNDYISPKNPTDKFIPIGNGIWLNETDKESLSELLINTMSARISIDNDGFVSIDMEESDSHTQKSKTLTELIYNLNMLPLKIIFAFDDTFKKLSDSGEENLINIQNSELLLINRESDDLVGDFILSTISLKNLINEDGDEFTPLYFENKIRNELKLPLKKLQSVYETDSSLENSVVNSYESQITVDSIANNDISSDEDIVKVDVDNDTNTNKNTNKNTNTDTSSEDLYGNFVEEKKPLDVWEEAARFKSEFEHSLSIVNLIKNEDVKESENDLSESEDDLDDDDYDDDLLDLDDDDYDDDLLDLDDDDYDDDLLDLDDDDYDDDDLLDLDDDNFDDEELNKLYEDIKNNKIFDDDYSLDENSNDATYNKIMQEYNINKADSEHLLNNEDIKATLPLGSEKPITISAKIASGLGKLYKKNDDAGVLKLLARDDGEMIFENIAAKPGIYNMTLSYSAMMFTSIDFVINEGGNKIPLEINGNGDINQLSKTSINIILDKPLNTIKFNNDTYQNILIEKLELVWVDSLENSSSHVVA